MPAGLAERLIREFGSISAVLGASAWRLSRNMPGKLANAVAASREIMKAALSERVAERPFVTGSRGLLDYLRLNMGFYEHERMIAVYVDHAVRLLKIINLEEGSSAGIEVNRQRILREGLAIGAAGFVLLHNHPAGDPHPSNADKVLTRSLFALAQGLEMPMIDHLIVAGGLVWSMKEDRLIVGDEP